MLSLGATPVPGTPPAPGTSKPNATPPSPEPATLSAPETAPDPESKTAESSTLPEQEGGAAATKEATPPDISEEHVVPNTKPAEPAEAPQANAMPETQGSAPVASEPAWTKKKALAGEVATETASVGPADAKLTAPESHQDKAPVTPGSDSEIKEPELPIATAPEKLSAAESLEPPQIPEKKPVTSKFSDEVAGLVSETKASTTPGVATERPVAERVLTPTLASDAKGAEETSQAPAKGLAPVPSALPGLQLSGLAPAIATPTQSMAPSTQLSDASPRNVGSPCVASMVQTTMSPTASVVAQSKSASFPGGSPCPYSYAAPSDRSFVSKSAGSCLSPGGMSKSGSVPNFEEMIAPRSFSQGMTTGKSPMMYPHPPALMRPVGSPEFLPKVPSSARVGPPLGAPGCWTPPNQPPVFGKGCGKGSVGGGLHPKAQGGGVFGGLKGASSPPPGATGKSRSFC